MAENVYNQQESLQSVARPQIWHNLASSVSFTQCKYWNNLRLGQDLHRAA